MQVFFVTGDNFHDITSEQIRLIGKGLEQGRKQLVLVPDRFSLTMEDRIMRELNLTATFDIEVASFARLASKVLSTVNAPQILSSLGATMVIEKIITDHARELNCFQNTSKTIAFAGVLFDSIAQLKSCKVTPGDIENNLENIKNSALKLKLQDIALIYKYYEEFLGSVYIDSNNRLTLLGEVLRDTIDLEKTDIHICNFDNTTDRALDVIKILVRSANSVSVGLLTPAEHQNNSDIYIRDMSSYFYALVKNLGITPNIISTKNTIPEVFKHILHNALAVNYDTLELQNSNNIKLFSAVSPNNEVEFVARDIINKVRSGVRYRDFSINCTNLESYAPIFTRVFEKYGIPFWIDNPYKLDDVEGTKFVLTALDVLLDNFQAKDVLSFAKNAFSGLCIDDYAVLENVVERYGIVGSRFMDDSKPNFPDEEFDKYLSIKNFLTPLFDLDKNIKGSRTVGEMISALRTFIEVTELQANLDGLAASFAERGDLLKQSLCRQNFGKLDNVLKQMLDILGSVESDLSQFIKILRAGISTVTISPLPMSVDCVYVGQSLASVFNVVNYYYIVGAADGLLPAYVADVGLIADYDIDELGANAVKIAPSIKQVNARSRASVLQSLCMGRRELVILYPLNKGGEECKPASVVESISNIFKFRERELPIIFLADMLEDDNAFGGAERRLGFLMCDDGVMLNRFVEEVQNPNRKISNETLASIYHYLVNKGYASVLDEIFNSLNSAQNVAKLENPAELFFTSGKARVTQIERFFACPYQHFIDYGLRIKERKKSTPEAVDIGNIMHAVFENFGKILRKTENKAGLSEAEIERVVPKIFDEVLQDKEYSRLLYSGNNSYLLDTLKDEAVRACKAINYQLSHSQYKIKFIETAFGVDGFARVPEVAVINSSKHIKISGKIDRADLWGNRLRIIDYKTSKASGTFSLLNLYLGKKIQLFYYLQVILKDLGLQAGGAYYLPVHREYEPEGKSTEFSSYKFDGVSVYTEANMLAQDDQLSFEHPTSDILKCSVSTSKANVEAGVFKLNSVKNSGATEEQFKEMLEYSKDVLEGAINDIYAGEIRPLYVDNACEWCKYKYICKKDVTKSAQERKSNFKIDLNSFAAENGSSKTVESEQKE